METRRLQKEYEELTKLSASNSGVRANIIGPNMTHWKGIINGPDDTVYQGGTFIIDIIIPSEYPYKPPKMKFDTKIWHPNISSQTGAICLDILKDEWSPALTIRTALLSLQALLCNPEPDDPQDAVVASQYKNNRDLFNQTARAWTQEHAKSPEKILEEKIKRLCEMGFTEHVVRKALNDCAMDEAAALNLILSES
ncbi:hypothetical protein SteCoe_37892 [Stentor coeruleus]|uniref:E2 ubiquitin-conjugating enzyme n=1 Tax=Stentor coeruleus TaxID=5963 RepID=A0A1R2AMJ1_9CILI|nr:hypothetical protein SteCoe_37892 [Stentor coeruleus]